MRILGQPDVSTSSTLPAARLTNLPATAAERRRREAGDAALSSVDPMRGLPPHMVGCSLQPSAYREVTCCCCTRLALFDRASSGIDWNPSRMGCAWCAWCAWCKARIASLPASGRVRRESRDGQMPIGLSDSVAVVSTAILDFFPKQSSTQQ